jgi:hypothetical protein
VFPFSQLIHAALFSLKQGARCGSSKGRNRETERDAEELATIPFQVRRMGIWQGVFADDEGEYS